MAKYKLVPEQPIIPEKEEKEVKLRWDLDVDGTTVTAVTLCVDGIGLFTVRTDGTTVVWNVWNHRNVGLESTYTGILPAKNEEA